MSRRPVSAVGPRDRDGGVSIVELIAVLAIFQVLLAAAFLLFNSVSSMTNTVEARSTASAEGQQALDTVAADLRQAIEATPGAGAFDICQPYQCRFTIDSASAVQRVTYQICGSALYRMVEQPDGDGYTVVSDAPVASLVQTATSQPLFEYFAESAADGQAVPATSAASVSEVVVDLRDGASANGTTLFVEQTTSVRVRTMNAEIE